MAMIDNRSVPELVADAFNQFAKLIRNEIQLAKAEMSAKATQAAIGAAFLAVAGLVSIAALVLALMALAALLIQIGWSAPLSYLAAAIVGVLLSVVCGWLGMNRLKPENLTPNRTIEQLRRDASAVKEHV
jgi:uncharacterized membrane protein YqjE